MRRVALLLGAVLLAGVAACGGGTDDSIRIGVLSVCRGSFAPLYEATLVGAEVPLLRRGGKPAGPDPEDGVKGAEIAGHKVDLVFGCSDDTAERALAEARRLVEQEHVQAIVGPLTSAAGIAIRDYAKTKPDVPFLIGPAPALAVTLKSQARNVFRFNGASPQAAAGLGAYAYRTLGWRNAVLVGDDFTFPYEEAGGFLAEFCSLGGRVARRVWIPLGAQDLGPYVRQLPDRDVDGYFLSFTFPQSVVSFVDAAHLRGSLARTLVLGIRSGLAAGSGGLGRRSVGVVLPSPPIGAAGRRYAADFHAAFSKVPFDLVSIAYFNAMEAALLGLEAVHGDLSGGSAALLKALDRVRVASPAGTVRLDSNRQAIITNHLVRVVRGRTGFAFDDVRTVPDVDASFGGRFTPAKPLPSRSSPACRHGHPPPWAR